MCLSIVYLFFSQFLWYYVVEEIENLIDGLSIQHESTDDTDDHRPVVGPPCLPLSAAISHLTNNAIPY